MGGGGRVSGQNKVCVLKIGLQFQAPLLNFIFPEEHFSDVGPLGLATATNAP